MSRKPINACTDIHATKALCVIAVTLAIPSLVQFHIMVMNVTMPCVVSTMRPRIMKTFIIMTTTLLWQKSEISQ